MTETVDTPVSSDPHRAGEPAHVEFTLNGEPVVASTVHPHLLAALREEFELTSPKDGCSPTGQCGCCTVLIDGKARVSCQTSMEKAAGSEIVTLEGVDQAEVDRMADAFAACGALQCGFCTPGIVMRTKALIDKNGSALTREQASRHLGAHLCRCTGYIKVLDAVEALAQDEVPVVVQPGGVGSRGIKYEGRELSVGTRDFIDDMVVPGDAARRAAPQRPRPRRHSLDRHLGGERARRRPRRVHRRGHPRRSTRRADPQGLADHDPRGRPHVVPR